MSRATAAYTKRVSAARAGLWPEKRPLLEFLDIELTERCNNDCVHCSINRPAADHEAARREMGTARVVGILEEAASLGCLTVRFTGGEPLLREDFGLIYLAARRLGLKVLLFTNATLITRRLAALFARVPPLERIEVSVYGMTRQTYEAATRNPGSYAALRRGLELLDQCGVRYAVKGAVLPTNRHEMGEFDAWASSLTGMDGPPSYVTVFDLRSRRDAEKNGLIRRLRLSPREIVRLQARWGEAFSRDMLRICGSFSRAEGARLFSCISGGGKASVDAYGFFQHCLLLRHPDTVCDLAEGGLRRALTEFLPRLRRLEARNAEYLARCGRCFLKGFCEQCPARSWSEHGTLDTPVDYLCEIAHVQAVAIGVLGEGEKAWEVADGERRAARLAREQGAGQAGPRRAERQGDKA